MVDRDDGGQAEAFEQAVQLLPAVGLHDLTPGNTSVRLGVLKRFLELPVHLREVLLVIFATVELTDGRLGAHGVSPGAAEVENRADEIRRRDRSFRHRVQRAAERDDEGSLVHCSSDSDELCGCATCLLLGYLHFSTFYLKSQCLSTSHLAMKMADNAIVNAIPYLLACDIWHFHKITLTVIVLRYTLYS